MPELIDRQALIKDMCNNKTEAKCPCHPNCYPCDFSEARRIIDIQPTIEPEVRHGRWIEDPYKRYPAYSIMKCSECGWFIHNSKLRLSDDFKFCPNCGSMNSEV